jgi:hypothetical protein
LWARAIGAATNIVASAERKIATARFTLGKLSHRAA